MKINLSFYLIFFLLFFVSTPKRILQQNGTNNNQSNQLDSENMIVINLPNPKSKLSIDQMNELSVRLKMREKKITLMI